MLANYIHDEKLIALFVQLMAYTGTPEDEVSGMLFAGMWVSYHHVGFCYFEGGSGAVTKALAEVVVENGGEILLNTLATKIVIEDGAAVAVQTKDGKEFKCRYVVSNANALDTFFKMVGREHLPNEYTQRLEKMVIGLPAFAVYLGVDHDFTKAFPPGIHSYFFNPGYDQNAGSARLDALCDELAGMHQRTGGGAFLKAVAFEVTRHFRQLEQFLRGSCIQALFRVE